jgi:hypothetical protein
MLHFEFSSHVAILLRQLRDAWPLIISCFDALFVWPIILDASEKIPTSRVLMAWVPASGCLRLQAGLRSRESELRSFR